MRRLKCFIASAFGRPDVDIIYSKVIKTTLAKLNIEPLRVDKINHNEKIDKKIIELIHHCDFAITDLTYARPSAYYEAGFVEGLNKKVIYLARHDHTKHRADDKEGNYRIHFDLITQNIILWKNNFNDLNKTLERRIRLITKPILAKLHSDSQELELEKAFDKKSIVEKLTLLREITPQIIASKKVREIEVRWGDILGVKGKGNKKQIFYCDFFSKLSLNDIKGLRTTNIFDKSRLKKYKDYNRSFILVVTLSKLSNKGILHSLPTYQQIDDTKTFINSAGDKISIMAFVDDVKSEKDYRNKLNNILTNLK